MTRALLITLAWVALATRLLGAIYSVDGSSGSDTNSGLAGAPWRTIQKAVGTPRSPGDTISVAGGEYREKLVVSQVGTAQNPITLSFASNAWLVGSVRLSNWVQATSVDVRGNANYPSIWWADLSAAVFDGVIADLSGNFYSSSPQCQIYADGTWLPAAVNMSRWPNGDKDSQDGDVYTFSGATLTNLSDAVHLTQPTNFWIGALMVFYRKANDSTYERRVTGWDPAINQLSWSAPLVYAPTNADRYFVLNNPGTIDEPWDFAVETSTRRLYMMFPDSPLAHTIDFSVLNDALTADGTSFFTLSGPRVRGFYRQGLWFREGTSVTITNALVDRNQRDYAVSFSHMTNSLIANSAFVGRGLTLSWGASNRIYRCVGFRSPVDALTVTYYETGSVVEESAFLEAWQNSHPDGLQTYMNPTNVLLRSVLWFNSGQHWQSADTFFSRATNCMWAVNHWSGGISMSGARHNSSNQWDDCTIYSANLLRDFSSGNAGLLTDSIVIPTGTVGSSSATNQGYADRNLFWQWGNPFRLTFYTLTPSNAIKSSTATSLLAYQTNSGIDTNSIFEDPQFANAPIRLVALASSPTAYNQFNRIYPASMIGFTNGGILEFNGDGVARSITNVATNHVEFAPPVETNWMQRTYRFPDGQTRVFFWGSNSNLAWDLRLRSTSPGASNLWASNPVGSSISIQGYRAGDFDGDGARDVPEFSGSSTVPSGPVAHYDFEQDFTSGAVPNRADGAIPIQRFGRFSGVTNAALATNWITATTVTNGYAVSTGARFRWTDGSGYGTYSKDGCYGGITNLNLGNAANVTMMLWARYLPTEALTPLWTDEHNATLMTGGRYSVAGAWNLGRENFWEGPLYANQTVFNFWVDAEATNRVQVPFPDTGDSQGGTDAMHHYAVVFKNGSIATYFDGALVTNKVGAYSTIDMNSQARWIGFGCWPHHGASAARDPWLEEAGQTWDEYPNNGWFNGLIDNVRIFDSALSAADIALIVDTENGVPPSPPSNPPPPPDSVTLNASNIVITE